MSNKKEQLYTFIYKGPNRNSEAYVIDLNNDSNKNWLLEQLGVNSLLITMQKKINSLERARFQLQKACLPQLTAALKPEMLRFIEKNYPDKAFKEWPVRGEFDDWYGWEACVKAFQELLDEGKITYKRGWNRLAKSEPEKVGETDKKVEVVTAQ